MTRGQNSPRPGERLKKQRHVTLLDPVGWKMLMFKLLHTFECITIIRGQFQVVSMVMVFMGGLLRGML